MLLEYLKEKYKTNEPIFVSDIDLPVTDANLRQMLKALCDSGQIRRFDTGIYYMPGNSQLKGGVQLSAGEVARYKYILRNGRIDGYYSGYTFANQLGLTAQVPIVLEIVSNHASAVCREVTVRDQKILLRRPRMRITKENCRILQLLDLLKDLDQYADDGVEDASKRIMAYAKGLELLRDDVDNCIRFYPDRVYKTIYEMRLYDAFT